MIRLPDIALEEEHLAALAAWQEELVQKGNYELQRIHAAALWKAKPKNKMPFPAVMEALQRMSCGAARCHYCEDSEGADIDHFRPKSIYPNLAFQWENFVWSCAKCNRAKGNRFGLIDIGENGVVSIRMAKHAQLTYPPEGDPALIHPREENGMDFLMLDFNLTFNLGAISVASAVQRLRAEETTDTLKLNRPALVEARKSAYSNFFHRLKVYVFTKIAQPEGERLSNMKEQLLRESHQTVWKEMQRQHMNFPELKNLFAQAPEALEW